jgi:hypothetical protein
MIETNSSTKPWSGETHLVYHRPVYERRLDFHGATLVLLAIWLAVLTLLVAF